MRFKPKGNLIAVLATLAIAVVSLDALLLSVRAFNHPAASQQIAAPVQKSTVALDPSRIIAKAAIVYDPATGTVLFSKNADEMLPLASLTKLATAHAILSEVSPAQSVTITQEYLQSPGGGLRAGDRVSIASLLALGFVASSNNAMAAAASSLGSQAMHKINQDTQKLGLTHSVFYNPTGLDLSTTTSGAYGSAWDVARLAAAFYKQYPSYFELTPKPTKTIQGSGRTRPTHAKRYSTK